MPWEPKVFTWAGEHDSYHVRQLVDPKSGVLFIEMEINNNKQFMQVMTAEAALRLSNDLRRAVEDGAATNQLQAAD